jgi:hypothetical protein
MGYRSAPRKGYTLNTQRLTERGVDEIEQAVGLLTRTLTKHSLVTEEGRAVLEVVQQYTRAWRFCDPMRWCDRRC